MPRSPKQKQKLLYLQKYFNEKTDEKHLVNSSRLIEYLSENDISAERKSIYDDIEALNSFGMDIVRSGGAKGGYFLASRDFELPEVKLLVDVVQSSKFITTKKSRELIKKLEKLVSENDAKQLQRQVVVTDRNKTANESIYYAVDIIHEAIAEDKTISFQYFEWDINKQMKLRKDGGLYKVSPWLLLWDDQNYYLVAYDDNAGFIKHYRVDKMLNLCVVDEKRTGKEEFEKIDVAAYSNRTFSMFAGQEKTVQLLCENMMTGVMVDRFGRDVAIRKYDDEHILVRVNIQVSPQFFGWLTGLSGKAKIYGPEDVVAEYKEYMQNILSDY